MTANPRSVLRIAIEKPEFQDLVNLAVLCQQLDFPLDASVYLNGATDVLSVGHFCDEVIWPEK